MNTQHSFRATIQKAGGGGAFVRVPLDVEEAFGAKRPKVKALIDGELYRGTLVRMGTEYHILGILKEIRAKIGKDIGDEVHVTLEADTEPRAVVVPADLAQAFNKDPRARQAFDALAYTHQREHVQYITEAKKPETRARRIAQTLDRLLKARKRA